MIVVTGPASLRRTPTAVSLSAHQLPVHHRLKEPLAKYPNTKASLPSIKMCTLNVRRAREPTSDAIAWPENRSRMRQTIARTTWSSLMRGRNTRIKTNEFRKNSFGMACKSAVRQQEIKTTHFLNLDYHTIRDQCRPG
ncbi:hypothetical protein NXS19_008450 [Fusarium pseudograminearum]|nr:hypothetical protein NXS19_008450 [Fusarium pseudograminearum]